jgi:hypothetical protein
MSLDTSAVPNGGDRSSFVHNSEFQAAAPQAGLSLGPLEREYQVLFAEALQDGVITSDERARLDSAANQLGLNPERLARLEDAMTAAFETHHRVRVVNQPLQPHTSLAPLEGVRAPLSVPGGAETAALQAENAHLREQIAALQTELARAQAHVNIELDFSGLDLAETESLEPAEAWKAVHQDPLNIDAHRRLGAAYRTQGSRDGEFLVAQALVALGAANPEEQASFETHRPQGLIAPQSSITEETWRNLIAHSDAEWSVGALFSVVAPAALVGHVTTLQRNKSLVLPAAESQQDPEKTTVMAVRALSWAAALLGIPVPRAFVDPLAEVGYCHVAGLPPVSVLGRKALSGKSVSQLAFLVGQHMSSYRGDHFVKTIFTATEDLEDLFVAALILADPKLPIRGAQRARIEPLARAIEPLLGDSARDALRSNYLRFVEEGGRTNLQRWSLGVEKTSCRAGLALSQDLPVALSLLTEQEREKGPLSLDLLSYSTSPKFVQLREALSIAVTSE